jgi:hypothetical protein
MPCNQCYFLSVRLWRNASYTFSKPMQTFLHTVFGALLLVGASCFQPARAQSKVADYAFGGAGSDKCTGSLLTSDGALLLSGVTYSEAGGEVTEPVRGTASRYNADYWITKTTTQGVKLWDKRFGGDAMESLAKVLATPDGGYLLCGDSYSGVGYDKSEDSRGESDYWIVKVDAQGIKQWDKRYGSSSYDQLNSAIITPDGGSLLVGTTFGKLPSGDRTATLSGRIGIWVVKLDAAGNKQWDKTFGSSNISYAVDIVSLAGGGYALGGSLIGTGGDVTATPHDNAAIDYWVIGLDEAGTKQWDRLYGGSDSESLHAMLATADGGLLLGGVSMSPVSGDKTQYDVQKDWWLIKVDAQGTKQWDQIYGPPRPNNSTPLSNTLVTMQQTPQGGYLLAGYSGWYGPALDPDDIPYRYWLINATATGAVRSQKILSGNRDNMATGLVQQGNTLWLVGSSASDVGGDRTAANRGSSDFWAVKYDATILATASGKKLESGLTLFPNPVSTGTLTIRLAGMKTQQPVQMKVVNALGQLVINKVLTSPLASTEYELPISDLPPGSYNLLLQTANGTLTKQFVKE